MIGFFKRFAMSKFDLSQNKQVFINDNLLVKSTVESLAADITETWIGLNNKDKSTNNSSRKSVTVSQFLIIIFL